MIDTRDATPGVHPHRKRPHNMSIGYDVAELLADLKKKDEQIARLAPNNFTEPESRITIDALRQIHHGMGAEARRSGHRWQAASAIQKLQVILDGFEAKRRADTELVTSLTEEERQLILSARGYRSLDLLTKLD